MTYKCVAGLRCMTTGSVSKWHVVPHKHCHQITKKYASAMKSAIDDSCSSCGVTKRKNPISQNGVTHSQFPPPPPP